MIQQTRGKARHMQTRRFTSYGPITLLTVVLAASSGCDSAEAEPSAARPDNSDAPPSQCAPGQSCEEDHDDHAGQEDHREHPPHDGPEESSGSDDHGGHDEEGGDVIELSASAIERGGIRVAPVTLGASASDVRGPAEVQPNPDRLAHVSPLVAGQLLRVGASLGDTVEAGQRLTVLRSIELGRARADYARARALLEVTNANFERQRRLRTEGISSERAFLEAQLDLREAEAERDAARAKLRVYGVRSGAGPDMPLTSPIDGVIIERHATNGENVSPEDDLFVVADLSRVWVIGRVYEQDVANLRPGMAATVTLRAFPGRALRGSLSYIASTLDEDTRSLEVRVELENPDRSLRPGMFGVMRLDAAAGEGQRVPMVPDAAVQELGGRTIVFVPGDEPSSFRALDVVIGSRSDGQVEVLEGLGPDARVVVEGAFILKSQLMRSELGEGHAH